MKFKSSDAELNAFKQSNAIGTFICRCNKNE